jgi:hypothetical protein
MAFQPNADDIDFNSDNEVFELLSNPHPKAGERSITAMKENRIINQRASAIMLRTQTDVRGSAGTIYRRTLWATDWKIIPHSSYKRMLF